MRDQISQSGVTRRIGAAMGAMIIGALVATGSAEAQTGITAFPASFVPAQKVIEAATQPDLGFRIIDGTVASDGAWPFQVALIRTGTESLFLGQFCGGSLITGRWVLTAAHCVYDEGEDFSITPLRPGDINILVGTNYLEPGGGEVIAADRVFAHPAYDPVKIDNDIALIRLEHAPQVANVGVVRLATVGVESTLAGPGSAAVVVGWGRLQDGRFPVDLRQVGITLFDRTECNRTVIQNGFDNTPPITNNMICSGDRGTDRGSCNGDSGGPLMVALADGSYMQVGVVSWGYTADNESGCSTDPDFSAFSRVSVYETWIRETILANAN